jgi:hypothetical protein
VVGKTPRRLESRPRLIPLCRSDTKLARALLSITNEEPPSRRFVAGADVVALAERKIAELHEQIEAHRELSTSLTFDPADDAEGTK